MAALGIAAAQLAPVAAGRGSPAPIRPPVPPKAARGPHTAFASLKQVDAGVLSVGYAEDGPADGPVVLASARLAIRHLADYVDVAPLLAAAGYRVLDTLSARLRLHAFPLPIRRGTASRRRCLSTPWLFLDALKVEKAIVVGYD